MFGQGSHPATWLDRSPSSGRSRVLGIWLALALVLGAGEAAAGQLQLTWVDNSGGEAGFRIERRAEAEAYAEVGVQDPGVTAFVDSTVVDGTTYCYRVQAYSAAGSSPYSNEACGSPAAATGLTLTVSVAGTGQGTVGSSPGGISCGTDCSEEYPSGAVVTLAAAAATGSTFEGWSGGGCAGADPCTLTGNGPITVAASFAAAPAPPTYALSVTESGPGKVTSSPPGINCSPHCSQAYTSGTAVALTATPGKGAQFLGWSGACSGTGDCVVVLGSATSVAATFSRSKGPK